MAQASGVDVVPQRPGWAAFDFDGTLVPGDSLLPFLTRVLGTAGLARLLTAAGVQTVQQYRVAGRDGAKAELLQRALTGRPAANLVDEGRRYADRLVQRVRPHMAERLRWHRASGHHLVLVSASLDLYLRPLATALRFDDIIATSMEVGPDGHLTGRIDGANVRGPEKARRLRQVIGDAPVELWAYGDTVGDREMLAMADHPLLVRRRTPR
ncbi:MAG: HAD-IB family hydrolase [Acidimicrobiales bacterium]